MVHRNAQNITSTGREKAQVTKKIITPKMKVDERKETAQKLSELMNCCLSAHECKRIHRKNFRGEWTQHLQAYQGCLLYMTI